MPSSKSLGLESKQFKVFSHFAAILLDYLGSFPFCEVVPIARQLVSQELQNQVSNSKLLKEDTAEMQLIVAAESGDTLHLLL